MCVNYVCMYVCKYVCVCMYISMYYSKITGVPQESPYPGNTAY